MKRKILKNCMFVAVLILIILPVFVYGQRDTKQHFKIGLAVLKDNPDYQAARTAFVDVLEEQKDATFEFKLLNAHGDLEAYELGLEKLVEEDKVDLIFTTGTRSTQPAVELIKEIPVVFTAIAEPVRAGIVKSLENPGANVTGTHCGVPAGPQIRAILKVLPSVKTIGIVYTKDEPNAEIQTQDLTQAAQELGLKVLTSTVSLDVKSQAEVEEATRKIADKVDVLVAHQDTSLSRYGKGMIKVAEENKKPTYVSLEQLLSEGAMFSLGIDFSKIGAMAGGQALLILQQGILPRDIPVDTDKHYSLVINLAAAEKIGLDIPVQVLRSATKIIK